MLLCDSYLTPATLDDAFDMMAAYRGQYRIVAGATDLLPWAREGRAGDVSIPVLIDVTGIPELRERRVDAGQVRLGAATPIQRFLDDPALGRALPCMARCAVWFADDQIRESATIGGNIVNASPAADGTPPLLAHDAEVELASRRDGAVVRRRLKLGDFVRGRSATALADDEILVAIECAALPGYGGSFEKVGHRRSLVISLVCLATLIKLDADGRVIEDARLAIGGIAPVPLRLSEVEDRLRGQTVSPALVRTAAELPVARVASRTRRAYRREVVRGFLQRGLVDALRRAGAGPDVLVAEAEAIHA